MKSEMDVCSVNGGEKGREKKPPPHTIRSLQLYNYYGTG